MKHIGTAKKNNNDRADQSKQFLFCAFYLVILAFFIMINSISTIEEQKKKKSIGSVKYIFSDQTTPTSLPYKLTINTDDKIAPSLAGIGDSIYSELHNLLTDSLALIEATISRDKKGIKIDIPMSTFFTFPNIKVKKIHYPFLSEIIEKLKSNKTLSLKIVLPNNTTDSYPTLKNSLPLKLSHPLTALFMEYKAPYNQVFIGIQSDLPESIIRFRFYGRETQKTLPPPLSRNEVPSLENEPSL